MLGDYFLQDFLLPHHNPRIYVDSGEADGCRMRVSRGGSLGSDPSNTRPYGHLRAGISGLLDQGVLIVTWQEASTLVVAPRSTVAVAGELGTHVLDLVRPGFDHVASGIVSHEHDRGHRAANRSEGEDHDRDPRHRVLVEVTDDVLDGFTEVLDEVEGVEGRRARVE